MCCCTYLCILWLILVCALTSSQTRNLSVSRQRSYQLSPWPGPRTLFIEAQTLNTSALTSSKELQAELTQIFPGKHRFYLFEKVETPVLPGTK